MLVNLNFVLKKAQTERYAVGLFNIVDTSMLDGVLTAAEELHAPVIIGMAEALLPYAPLNLLAPSVLSAAQQASVPVVVHFDHSRCFESCMQALRLGFTSVMFDGSESPWKKNIADTARIVQIAHAMGATVEGEIGHVGGSVVDSDDPSDCYTTASEAQQFVAITDVDALAVAIGTAHGVYKEAPHLDIPRLQEIRSCVDVPLVLHGGSGLSAQDFRSTIENGIAKINVFTDLCHAGMDALRCGLDEGSSFLQLQSSCMQAYYAASREKMLLFDSAGRG